MFLSPLTGFAIITLKGEAKIIEGSEWEPTLPGVRLLANEMSEVYTLLALIVGVWIACFIQSHRLFYKFRAKYPDIAQREIPHAFETRENPEKLLYFLRRKSLVAGRPGVARIEAVGQILGHSFRHRFARRICVLGARGHTLDGSLMNSQQ